MASSYIFQLKVNFVLLMCEDLLHRKPKNLTQNTKEKLHKRTLKRSLHELGKEEDLAI